MHGTTLVRISYSMRYVGLPDASKIGVGTNGDGRQIWNVSGTRGVGCLQGKEVTLDGKHVGETRRCPLWPTIQCGWFHAGGTEVGWRPRSAASGTCRICLAVSNCFFSSSSSELGCSRFTSSGDIVDIYLENTSSV